MREAGADIVAEQLLALHADPVRHRARLTHGREPLPGAIHAFRFAQAKLPKGLLKQFSAAERDRLLDAADFFIRQVCLWEGATHHQVLGVAPDSPPEAIKENYHALMALLHPDRQGAGADRWPASAAQRVNQAYAVLSDKALRAEYEAGMGKATHAARDFAAFEAPPAGPSPSRVRHRAKGTTAARAKHLKTFLLATAALACLFVLNRWWVGDVPDEYETLQSATPFESSWRWMRETISSDARPRYIGSGTPAVAVSRDDVEPQVVKTRPEPALAPVTLALAEVVPQARADVTAPLLPEARPEPVRLAASLPPARVEAATPAPRAQLQPATTIAQAPAPAKSVQPSPQASAAIGQLETLVTQLVSHYEAGDLDRFLGLFDTGRLGVFEAVGVRSDYGDFFHATGSRQLRLRSLAWDSASQPERAQGEAHLTASYKDRAERIDRVVKVDIAIAWVDGRPRIARLSLFPRE